MIYRRARFTELEKIITLQSNIFHTEQGIPEDDVNEFLSRNPICWCAEQDGEICGTAIAWKADGIVHWGRFVVIPSMRGRKIGPKLARYSFEDLFEQGVLQAPAGSQPLLSRVPGIGLQTWDQSTARSSLIMGWFAALRLC